MQSLTHANQEGGMRVEELKKEYATQDNRATAYPIYVTVQELHCVGVMADGHAASCPHGDDETRIEYTHPDLEGEYESEEELIKALEELYGDEDEDKDKINSETSNIEALTMGYIWVDVEFFLTIKGAEEYMKANAHNHGKLRTYVKHFERRNFEMRELLDELGFKTKD